MAEDSFSSRLLPGEGVNVSLPGGATQRVYLLPVRVWNGLMQRSKESYLGLWQRTKIFAGSCPSGPTKFTLTCSKRKKILKNAVLLTLTPLTYEPISFAKQDWMP